MKIIRALFVGQDSLGYENSKEYVLYIEKPREWVSRSDIRIWRVNDNEGWCLYQNIETFLDNWSNIQTRV